jgi:prophage regulatory protein
MATQSTYQRIIRRKEVETRTGLARSTIYQRIKEGSFPSPVSLGSKAVGWVESEIDDWLNRQIDSSRKSA